MRALSVPCAPKLTDELTLSGKRNFCRRFLDVFERQVNLSNVEYPSKGKIH